MTLFLERDSVTRFSPLFNCSKYSTWASYEQTIQHGFETFFNFLEAILLQNSTFSCPRSQRLWVHTVLASGNPPFSYFPNIAIREVNIPRDVFPLLFLKSNGKRPPKYTIDVRQFFLVFTDVLVKWFSLGIAPYFDDHSAAAGGNIHGVYVVLSTEKVRRYYFSNKRIKLKYCAHLCSDFLSLSPPVQPKICPDINNKCTRFTARNLSLHIVDQQI